MNWVRAYKPSRQDIDDIIPGSPIQDTFGHHETITDVFARGVDVNGKAFVCFYATLGKTGSRMSDSYKEGELHRTVELSNHYTSRQLDDIESWMGDYSLAIIDTDRAFDEVMREHTV